MSNETPPPRPTPGQVALWLLLWGLAVAVGLVVIVVGFTAIVLSATLGKR